MEVSLAVKCVQNPWLALNQVGVWAEVRAARAVQQYHKRPGRRAGLELPRACAAAQPFTRDSDPCASLQGTQTNTTDANKTPESIFMFTLFSCMVYLYMLGS